MIAIECPCLVPADGAPEWMTTVGPFVAVFVLLVLTIVTLVALLWVFTR